MKHTLIGTAGHVDHGKTALIRALTGIETDRLAEEKSRGITIDLGFAHMTLPGGEEASIIDVPGHEKFIKNMLAGAGGIDLVLLVVAADDGIMPQTREHLGILQFLKAKDGIIVLTKCDLCDEEWQNLVCEDISAVVNGTFLQNAPIIRVSSHTGHGIDQLKECISDKVRNMSGKNISTPFRIPIDRVFSSEGFGTVVTGTLIEGTLRQGEGICVFPGGTMGRVRNLQVHGSQVECAFAGQRVAVNISGVRREDILRGHVLAPADTIQPSRMLDVKLSIINDGAREIKTGSRLHFHYGTQNALCKLSLIGSDKLLPGQGGYAQLRFTEDIAVKNGDSFVVRFYSPIETVGGGVVLNTAPKKYRRGRAPDTIKALEALEKGDIGTQICQAIVSSGGISSLEELRKRFGLDVNAWEGEIEALHSKGQIKLIGSQAIVYSTYQALEAQIESLLKTYHKDNPLHKGIPKEEMRSRILPKQKSAFFDELLNMYSHLLQVNDGRVALKGFEIAYTKEQGQIRDSIINRLKQSGYTPPSIDELLAPNKKLSESVFEALLAEGGIVSTEPGIVFDITIIEQAKANLMHIAEDGDGTITLAQFRDKAQTSRKFALSILEYFDRSGITRKIDDYRILL